MEDMNAPLMEHLNELRKVFIVSAIALVIGTIITYAFLLDWVMALVMAPIDALNVELNFLQVTEGFMAHLKVALLAGAIIASPVILWQIISFILPALYKHERRIFFLLIFFTIVLFVTGIAFGYFFVITLGLNALLFTFSGDLTPVISVSSYVNFVLCFLIPFGLIFEIPLFVYFLTKVGIVNPVMLKEKRKYILLVILVLAAVLTPPDVISQILLAIPMLFLYECSIKISSVVYKKRMKKMAKEAQKGS